MEPFVGTWSQQDNAGAGAEIGPLGVLTADVVHSAQLEVCSRVADVAEARELLAMLGLGAP